METPWYIIRCVVAGLCGLIWLFCAAGNAATVIAWLTRRRRSSLVPVIGGLFGVGAVYALPIDIGAYRLAWAFLPAFLDIGSIPIVFAVVIAHVRRAMHGKEPQ